jgi:hypothetical protein
MARQAVSPKVIEAVNTTAARAREEDRIRKAILLHPNGAKIERTPEVRRNRDESSGIAPSGVQGMAFQTIAD